VARKADVAMAAHDLIERRRLSTFILGRPTWGAHGDGKQVMSFRVLRYKISLRISAAQGGFESGFW